MNKRILCTGVMFLILGSMFSAYGLNNARADSPANAKTLILYDAASGSPPDPSLMGFTAFPPDAVSLTYSDGISILDTTLTGLDAYAGWTSAGATIAGFPVLDRAAGVRVDFTMQMESETHDNQSRSGFSVIVLDKDARGIELAFWQNEIWAQNDDTTGGLFTHGEGAAVATTAGLTDYELTLNSDTYTLTANAVPILNGPVRDYTVFEGFLDPYETPNFLFLGDDTTSAQARVQLRFVSVTGTEPTVPVTATGPSTDLPLPTESLTPLPSATPAATLLSTPTDRTVELCPSGWLLPLAMMGSILIVTKLRRG